MASSDRVWIGFHYLESGKVFPLFLHIKKVNYCPKYFLLNFFPITKVQRRDCSRLRHSFWNTGPRETKRNWSEDLVHVTRQSAILCPHVAIRDMRRVGIIHSRMQPWGRIFHIHKPFPLIYNWIHLKHNNYYESPDLNFFGGREHIHMQDNSVSIHCFCNLMSLFWLFNGSNSVLGLHMDAYLCPILMSMMEQFASMNPTLPNCFVNIHDDSKNIPENRSSLWLYLKTFKKLHWTVYVGVSTSSAIWKCV